jgi:uncharacterized membrane protein
MKLKFLPFAFCWLVGCNYSKSKQEPGDSLRVNLQKLDKVDYEMVSKTVLSAQCIGCHSNGGGNQGGVNLESYALVRKQLARVSYRALEKMDMPPRSGLNSNEVLVLRTWVENGAPEKYADVREGNDRSLDEGPTDWKKISEKIFAQKCLDCHSQPSPQGKLDMTSYAEVKEKAALIFDRIFIRQDMPVEPYPTLSPKERKTLLSWFNMGMPN